jgi:hypothetical protein
MRVHRILSRARVVLAALAGLALSGCESLLDVEFPGRIPAEQINNPTLAPVLVRSVIGDVECAYNNYVAATSIHSDEYETSNSNVPGANWGERSITADEDDYVVAPCEGTFLGFGLHAPMQTARFQAEDIFARLNAWTDEEVPNRKALLATVRTYGGFPYLFFGETFCSIAFDGEPEVTRAASLAIAEQRFTEAVSLAQAIADPATRDDVLNLARVGLARTKMNLKKWGEAQQVAAQVSVGYEKVADRGTENDRRWNKLYKNATDLGMYVIGDAYRTMNDPRVPIRNTGRPAFNPLTELWINTKYPALGSPIRLASYREAQLIVAEAQAQQGNVGPAMTILNGRRDELSLPRLTAATPAEAVSAVIEERRRELSFEGGHRLNDLLRYSIPWKIGFNRHTARPYGTITCWPLPTKEIAGA